MRLERRATRTSLWATSNWVAQLLKDVLATSCLGQLRASPPFSYIVELNEAPKNMKELTSSKERADDKEKEGQKNRVDSRTLKSSGNIGKWMKDRQETFCTEKQSWSRRASQIEKPPKPF